MTLGLAVPVVILLLAVSTLGGWPVTRAVLHQASRSADAGEAHAAAQEADESDGPEGERAQTVLRGGTWIGFLERLAVTGSLMIGQPEVVAVVVAVKGLGRYPELRQNPGASERFVIGTLASLVWAAALGYLGRWLLV
ncbi:hypothetical protein ACTHAM_002653 [Cellulomonas soli]|uniref:hypothetical protein n=1 Tax=Cellulomonas soli TaxID=931535 RepID=UPI003F846F26